jgi:membrane protein DedA with SNARE-associated domain
MVPGFAPFFFAGKGLIAFNPLEHLAGAHPLLQAILIALSTFFFSEDMTVISAGLLASAGVITIQLAFWACFIGIYVGDSALYLIGRVFGRRALQWPWIQRLLPPHKQAKAERWFQRNGITTVFLARFLPGTRLTIYLSAGLLGASPKLFLGLTFLAALIWTPALLALTFYSGEQVMTWFHWPKAHPLLAFVLAALLLWSLMQLIALLGSSKKRLLLDSRLFRITHWEFWPTWLFYLPVVGYNFYCAYRFRSWKAFLFANGCFPFGGMVGERKTDVLDKLPTDSRHRVPYFLVDPEHPQDWQKALETNGMKGPYVLKPNSGERGRALLRVEDHDALQEHLKRIREPVLIQPLLTLPFEFGISFHRDPASGAVHTDGLCGKVFPRLVGDGKSDTLTLLTQDPLMRGRCHTLVPEDDPIWEELLADGEVRPLVQWGNHCRGTVFYDASHLLTETIETAVSAVVNQIPGLHIGRLDVRCPSLRQFRENGDFLILEINGTTSEPAFAYDRRFSLRQVYRIFFDHWRRVWEIGSLKMRQTPQSEHALPAFLRLWAQTLRTRKKIDQDKP